MTPSQQIHQVVETSGTTITVSVGLGSAIMAFFDAHAAGIGAMVAIAALVINTCINIWFKRQELKRGRDE